MRIKSGIFAIGIFHIKRAENVLRHAHAWQRADLTQEQKFWWTQPGWDLNPWHTGIADGLNWKHLSGSFNPMTYESPGVNVVSLKRELRKAIYLGKNRVKQRDNRSCLKTCWYGLCYISQSYKTVEVRRELWRSSGVIPLVRQAHLELAAQDHVQAGYEPQQGWTLYNFSGQPVWPRGVIS